MGMSAATAGGGRSQEGVSVGGGGGNGCSSGGGGTGEGETATGGAAARQGGVLHLLGAPIRAWQTALSAVVELERLTRPGTSDGTRCGPMGSKERDVELCSQ